MKKTKVFQPIDIIDVTKQKSRRIVIPAPHLEKVEPPEPVYTGATPDEIRLEIAQLRQEWIEEKSTQEEDLTQKLERALEQNRAETATRLKEAEEQAQQILKTAREEAAAIEEQTKQKIESMLAETEAKISTIEEEGKDKGREAGKKEGYTEGFIEVKRLTGQLHNIIAATLQRRDDIISSLESELIDLTLLMTRKVVKVLTENQKDIVIYNTLEALKKMRSRGHITLHINPEDIDVATENKDLFIRELERLEGVTVAEDHTVGRGGCIVETDFGEIDARIASQLRAVEDKILSIKPVQRKVPKHLGEDIVYRERFSAEPAPGSPNPDQTKQESRL